MCGIAGIINYPQSDINLKLDKMLSSIHHRGPDSNGVYCKDGVGLAHSRLSILDLSSLGNQPMIHAETGVVLVYNGEIYNFKPIREKLISEGHTFASNTDTEVVLQSYLAYGIECLHSFRGMFAFTIYDPRYQTIFAARDHFGIKPFNYFYQQGTFVFSSEIRALLASGLVPSEVNKVALHQLFLNGYIIQPDTFIKGVKSLKPGHYVKFRVGDAPKEIQYWNLSSERSQALVAGKSYEEKKKAVRDLLISSVEEQLMSDVPVGAFLSGGIDSTLIVGIITEILGKKIDTHSVIFPSLNAKLDESEIARRTAARYGTHHNEIEVGFDQINSKWVEMAKAMDQPCIGWMHWHVISEETKKHCSVALSGLGADEFFHGYRWLEPNLGRKVNLYKQIGSLLKNLGITEDHLASFPLGQSGLFKNASMWQDEFHEIFARHGIMNLSDASEFVEGQYNSENVVGNFAQSAPLDYGDRTFAKDMSYLIAKSRMLSVDIRDLDAGSMAHSLEVRVPFLDLRLTDLAFGLSFEDKFGKVGLSGPIRGKRILIDAFEDILPLETYARPKRGFNLPNAYLIENYFKDHLDQKIFQSNLDSMSFLNSNKIKKLWSDNRIQLKDYRPIWVLCSILNYIDDNEYLS
jgi:asparagine synthase (glutamine-hydrolysing)